MTTRNYSYFARSLTVSLLTLAALALAGAAPAEASEIRVTLFGQTCTMNGPYPEAILTAIHEISPEKIPPTLKTDQMKALRTKAASLKGVSPQLETYREHLKRRLSAKIAYEEAMTEVRKNPATPLATVLKNIKEHIPAARVPAFEKDAKALFDRIGGKWSESFTTPFREKYENLIQPDTEEEFHKAIRVSKVQYVCAFDEGTEDNPAEPEDE